jgi:putative proteasome-type protease
MTYCLAIKVDEGLVFASDSLTHGGVDNINIYSKMHTFAVNKERVFVLLSAGNLATTQAVINTIQRDLSNKKNDNLSNVKYMFDAAHYIGTVSRAVQKQFNTEEQQNAASFGASFIIGGQIHGFPPELFLIYPEGNYIAISQENPFLQIGETKYGKPILDRIITCKTPLTDAGKCALVSIDSTIRSNLSVGPPIELLHYRDHSFDLSHHEVFREDDKYLRALRESWNSGLQAVFNDLPPFDWEK